MKVAVEGCAYGELDRIYASVVNVQEKHNIIIDLLICCGNFQSVRDKEDMEDLSSKPEYRRMHDFHKYYTGEKVAPVTTIFIGGSHEVPSFLRDLYYGGWVAPNIYYLGAAGVLRVGSLRIAGLSGRFRPQDYFTGHHECPPYTDMTRRSANNVRDWDVERLARVTEPIDIVVSHDWPRGIWKHGNSQEMLDHRDHNGDLRREMDGNSLGNLAAMELLKKLRPGFWFSSHLNVKFAALVPHGDGTFTRFLALDKCNSRRDFLQVLDIDPRSPSFVHRIPAAAHRASGGWAQRWRGKENVSNKVAPSARLDYDPEWLAIQKVNHAHLVFTSRNQKAMIVAPTKGDITWVVQRLRENCEAVARKRTRRHESLLPTKLREASGEKSFRDLSTAQLKELFDTRGLEFPGHLDKASLTRQLEEHDEFFAAERNVEQTAADEAFPIPENFVPERTNAASQRHSLLEMLELPDFWKEQEEERRERMRDQTSGIDPVSEALTSQVDQEQPSATDASMVVEPAPLAPEVIPSERNGAESSPSSPEVVAAEVDLAGSSPSSPMEVVRTPEAMEAAVSDGSCPDSMGDADLDVSGTGEADQEGQAEEGAVEQDSAVEHESHRAAPAPDVSAASASESPLPEQHQEDAVNDQNSLAAALSTGLASSASPEAEQNGAVDAENLPVVMSDSDVAAVGSVPPETNGQAEETAVDEEMLPEATLVNGLVEAGSVQADQEGQADLADLMQTADLYAPVEVHLAHLMETQAAGEEPMEATGTEWVDDFSALAEAAAAAEAEEASEAAEAAAEEAAEAAAEAALAAQSAEATAAEVAEAARAVLAARTSAIEPARKPEDEVSADNVTLPIGWEMCSETPPEAALAAPSAATVEGEIAALEGSLAELDALAGEEEDHEVQDEIALLESSLAELEATDAILNDADDLGHDEAPADFDPYAGLEDADVEPPLKAQRLA